MTVGRIPSVEGGIQPTLLTTKGDIIVATGNATLVRQGVGSNNQVLMADSAQADGIKWANEATATLTTTGDTLYASAANTPARLAIGSTGNVLTVAGGVPTWATPTTPNFIGVMCERTSGTISMTANVDLLVPFTSEVADTNNFHDNSTNTTRFTVPSGLGGKYLLTGAAFLDVGSNSRFTLFYYKNGSSPAGNLGFMQQAANMASNNQSITGSRVVNLVAGDYIEFAIRNDNTTTPTVYAAFYMTYLGA